MLQDPSTQHVRIIGTLTRIRQEWQDATGCSSLTEVEGNVGMLLADRINEINLEPDEQLQILGTELFHEINEFCTCRNKAFPLPAAIVQPTVHINKDWRK